jgi:hypothetical protein
MIGRIFNSLYDSGLKSLIAVGQLLDALIGGIRNRRKGLPIARLPRAIGSYLPGIVTEFVWSCLLVAASFIHHDDPHRKIKTKLRMVGCGASFRRPTF